jgi:hypothetical protein
MCIPSASSAPLRAKRTRAETHRAQREGRQTFPTPVTLNLFQGPFILSSSERAARWTLKQVQGDEVEG